MKAFFGWPGQLECSTKVALPSSVILSEASGGNTFPVAVGQAEAKDLGGIVWDHGVKVMQPSTKGGEPAIGDETLSAFDHRWMKVAGSFDCVPPRRDAAQDDGTL